MASVLEEEEDLVFDVERNNIGRPQGLLQPLGTERNRVEPDPFITKDVMADTVWSIPHSPLLIYVGNGYKPWAELGWKSPMCKKKRKRKHNSVGGTTWKHALSLCKKQGKCKHNLGRR